MTRKRQSLPDGPLYDPRGRGAAAVATLSWEYACGHHVPEHFHDEDQLVYAARGMMTVRAPGGLWFVPPRRAVWIPAKVAHAIDMTASVSMKTLYMEPRLVKGLPRECRVVHVSALLHELVLRACAMGKLRRDLPKEAHVTALLVDELEAARRCPRRSPACATRARFASKALSWPTPPTSGRSPSFAVTSVRASGRSSASSRARPA